MFGKLRDKLKSFLGKKEKVEEKKEEKEIPKEDKKVEEKPKKEEKVIEETPKEEKKEEPQPEPTPEPKPSPEPEVKKEEPQEAPVTTEHSEPISQEPEKKESFFKKIFKKKEEKPAPEPKPEVSDSDVVSEPKPEVKEEPIEEQVKEEEPPTTKPAAELQEPVIKEEIKPISPIPEPEPQVSAEVSEDLPPPEPQKPKKEVVKEEKPSGFFARLTSKISSKKIEQEHVDEIFGELEMILLENNVALEVVDKIKENLSKDLVGKEVKKDKLENTITDSLKNSISEVLIEPENIIEKIKAKTDSPYTIVFFGINGSGKTTSIAKFAHKLKKEKISCVLAAADTFRAASIEQLETHGNRLGIEVIKQEYGTDPTAVAFDAKKYAEKNKIQCVLIDTAGRMYTKENLIKQMEKIIRIIKPDLKIFVGESITGNDATTQAKTFNEAVGIDGIILSKADVDEKGGTILSVSYVTNKPIYYLGTGQLYDDLESFNPKEVLKKIGLE